MGNTLTINLRNKKARKVLQGLDKVQQLICSQEDEPGTSKTTRQIANEMGISDRSVFVKKYDIR